MRQRLRYGWKGALLCALVTALLGATATTARAFEARAASLAITDLSSITVSKARWTPQKYAYERGDLMGEYMERSDLVVAGVTLLMERTNIRKDLALASAKELASKIPTVPDWGDGNDKVRADAEVGFLTDLLKPYLRPSSTEGRDEIISFEAPLPDPIKELDALFGEIKAQEAAARSVGSILGGTPVQVADSSFASDNGAFHGAVRPAPVASAALYVPAPVGKNISGPGLTLARRMEIQAEVARDMAVIVRKACSDALAKPVAKADHVLRIVPKV